MFIGNIGGKAYVRPTRDETSVLLTTDTIAETTTLPKILTEQKEFSCIICCRLLLSFHTFLITTKLWTHI